MATALPHPRADRRTLTGLLFAVWAVVVLAAYWNYHPLPMRDGVPVWKGALMVIGMLAVSWPLWRHANPRRGFQVEHLLLLPILLAAVLAMLPLLANTGIRVFAIFFPFLLWSFVADLLRQRLGKTGFILALLIWFPGSFAMSSTVQFALTLLFMAIIALPLWVMRKNGSEPHRYIKRAAAVALAIGVLLSLADIQRRYAPIGYLTGIVDETTWIAANTVEVDANLHLRDVRP